MRNCIVVDLDHCTGMQRLRDRVQEREQHTVGRALEPSAALRTLRRVPQLEPVLFAGHVPAMRRCSVRERVPDGRVLP